jgi:hypothetical protein
MSIIDLRIREYRRSWAFTINSPQADISQGFEGEDIFRFRVEISGLIVSGKRD